MPESIEVAEEVSAKGPMEFARSPEPNGGFWIGPFWIWFKRLGSRDIYSSNTSIVQMREFQDILYGAVHPPSMFSFN